MENRHLVGIDVMLINLQTDRLNNMIGRVTEYDEKSRRFAVKINDKGYKVKPMNVVIHPPQEMCVFTRRELLDKLSEHDVIDISDSIVDHMRAWGVMAAGHIMLEALNNPSSIYIIQRTKDNASAINMLTTQMRTDREDRTQPWHSFMWYAFMGDNFARGCTETLDVVVRLILNTGKADDINEHCTICLDTFGEYDACVLRCGHAFHKQCLIRNNNSQIGIKCATCTQSDTTKSVVNGTIGRWYDFDG